MLKNCIYCKNQSTNTDNFFTLKFDSNSIYSNIKANNIIAADQRLVIFHVCKVTLNIIHL